MSAWLVSNYHVNALVTFAVDQGLTNKSATVAGLDLWQENANSLRYRYSDRADQYWPELPCLAALFTYTDVTVDSVWTILKAAHCYEYQSCEHPGWKTSEAQALISRIVDRCVHMLGLTSGDDPTIHRHHAYEAAPWGLEA